MMSDVTEFNKSTDFPNQVIPYDKSKKRNSKDRSEIVTPSMTNSNESQTRNK